MKYTFLLIITIFAATQVVAQETRSKNTAPTEPQSEIQVGTLEREIQHLEQRLERLRTASIPKGETDQAIRKAQIHELETQKMWKEKELAIAKAESANEDVAGLRGEAKALNERYKAAKDKRAQLEHRAAAIQAEKDDETAVPNQKIEMQHSKLSLQLEQLQSDLEREQKSRDPDAERIAKLKGEIEATRRQMRDLNERK